MSNIVGHFDGEACVPDLSVTVDRNAPARPVLALCGEVDLATAPILAQHLAGLANTQAAVVVVDLSEVRFIDSSGLAALITAREQFTKLGRQLVVVADAPIVLRVFEITGLDKVFTIVATRLEADAAFSGQVLAA